MSARRKDCIKTVGGLFSGMARADFAWDYVLFPYYIRTKRSDSIVYSRHLKVPELVKTRKFSPSENQKENCSEAATKKRKRK